MSIVIAQPDMRIHAHEADLRCTSPYKSDGASECDKWHPDAPLCCAYAMCVICYFEQFAVN